MASLCDAFAINLKAARLEAGLSQKKLAVKSGYAEDYIRKMENGQKCNPTLWFVETMANSLSISPFKLLGDIQHGC